MWHKRSSFWLQLPWHSANVEYDSLFPIKSIKYQLGKLPLPESPEIYLPKQRDRHQIMSLMIDEKSVLQLIKLPPLHRDPFDRLIICQAIQNDLTIITVDHKIRSYPIIKILN